MKKRKHRIHVRARSLTSIATNMAKLIYYRQCGYSEKNIKRAARYMVKTSQYMYPSLKDVKVATSSWEYEQKVFNEFARTIKN